MIATTPYNRYSTESQGIYDLPASSRDGHPMERYVMTDVGEDARYARYESYDDVGTGAAGIGAASPMPRAKSHRWISGSN